MNVLLRQPYVLTLDGGPDIRIRLAGDPGAACLRVSNLFLDGAAAHWLTSGSMPDRPLRLWRTRDELPEAQLASDLLPVLFAANDEAPYWRQADTLATLNLDVFGSAFFMLTRYEELVTKERDQHGRFPATASLAYQEDFLHRPIINEYAEILWACMKRVWPQLERPAHEPRVLLSHDVDRPLLPYATPPRVALSVGADLLKRRDPVLALRRLRAYAARRRGDHSVDPHNTFDQIMDLSETHGLKSAFYFIAGNSAGVIDGEYSLTDPFVRRLMRRVHERGHEVGLHPSYGSYRDPRIVRREFAALRHAAKEFGINQSTWGGRQHYLRWEAPTTWQAWEDAGLTYDSSVGYADHVGFRTGVCTEYPVFNVLTRQALALTERPLIVMEGTLLSKAYMGLDYREAARTASELIRVCRRFRGDFTLLWHNSHLITRQDWTLLRQILSEATASP